MNSLEEHGNAKRLKSLTTLKEESYVNPTSAFVEVNPTRETSASQSSNNVSLSYGICSVPTECSKGSNECSAFQASSGNVLKRRRCARDVSEYRLIGPVGEGAYGVVWKAIDPLTGEKVALKMIKTGSDSGAADSELGFPITSIREIRILKALNNDNIVNLKDVVTDMEGKMKGGKQGGVYMVFEYLDADLEGILKTPEVRLTPLHIKSFMHQLLLGLEYMHRHKVVHRDMKGANLLVSAGGQLKIGDFGLARSLHANVKVLTSKVITLWYRPPELLMRGTMYDASIDMWSVGCIFGELLQGSAILPGRDERDQMEHIFNLCGTPTSESWSGVTRLPDWETYWKDVSIRKPRLGNLSERFKHLDRNTLDLLSQLLQLDPSKRISARKALDHDYFYDAPKLVAPDKLPRLNFRSCHELDAKKRHEQEKAARLKREEQERAARVEAQRQAAIAARDRGMTGNSRKRESQYYDHLKRPISKESTGW